LYLLVAQIQNKEKWNTRRAIPVGEEEEEDEKPLMQAAKAKAQARYQGKQRKYT